MPWTPILAASTLALMGLLIVAESIGSQPLRAFSKTAASTAFVACALSAGALDSGFGRAVLAALVLSWFGDVFLLSTRDQVFRLGLFSFLAGHLLFGVAFLVRGVSVPAALVSAAVLLVPALVVHRWLAEKVRDGLKKPVVAYIVVISLMVALAGGTFVERGGPLILVAAVCFFLSDLSVARDRFVQKAFTNKVWGLPLYYGAQVLFALSVS